MFLALQFIVSSTFVALVLCSNSLQHNSLQQDSLQRDLGSSIDCFLEGSAKHRLLNFTKRFVEVVAKQDALEELMFSMEMTSESKFELISSRNTLLPSRCIYQQRVSRRVGAKLNNHFDALDKLIHFSLNKASQSAVFSCAASKGFSEKQIKKLLPSVDVLDPVELSQISTIFNDLEEALGRNALMSERQSYLEITIMTSKVPLDGVSDVLMKLFFPFQREWVRAVSLLNHLRKKKFPYEQSEEQFINLVLERGKCNFLFSLYGEEPSELTLERILTRMTIRSLEPVKEAFKRIIINDRTHWPLAVSIFDQRRKRSIDTDLLEEPFINKVLQEEGWRRVLNLYKASPLLDQLTLSRDQAGRMAIYSNSDSIEGLVKSIKYFETKFLKFSFNRKISSMFRAEFDRLINEHWLIINPFDLSLMFSRKLELDFFLCKYVVKLFEAAVRLGLQIPKLTVDWGEVYVFNHQFQQILDCHRAVVVPEVERLVNSITSNDPQKYFYDICKCPRLPIETLDPLLAKVLESDYEVRMMLSDHMCSIVKSMQRNKSNPDSIEVSVVPCKHPIVSIQPKGDFVVIYAGNFVSEAQVRNAIDDMQLGLCKFVPSEPEPSNIVDDLELLDFSEGDPINGTMDDID